MPAVDMCIDLCGANVGVTEQFLHHPQIRPALQKVGRKGVPQHVGMDMAKLGALGASADNLPHRNTCQWPTTVRKQQRALVASILKSR